MKKIITHLLTLSLLLIITSSLCHGQANTSLSNLVAPTAVNVDLLPNKTNKLNLGSSGKSWKRLYIVDGLYRDTTRIFSADSTNTVAGFHVLSINTGKFNTAVGSEALRSNSTGVLNTANGASALLYNTSGSGNTAIGTDAIYSNTTGNFNTATGYFALALNKTGITNVAYGDYALYSDTTGYSNVAIGSKALYKNTTHNNLVAIGDSALLNNSGDYNTAVGSKALFSNNPGGTNTALGYQALYANVSGSGNTALGSFALISATNSNNNTAVGRSALLNNTIGSSNVAFGNYTLGQNINGSYNTALGYDANVAFDPINNSAAIGANASVDASNKIRIGNTAIESIGGQVGWTTFSDGRYKKNIQENVPGLDFINALRPVTYTVDINGLNNYFRKGSQPDSVKNAATKKADEFLKDSYDKASKIVHTGFIAQEVEAVANKLNYDFSGVDKPEDKNKLYGLRYDEFVVPLVKAVQELSNENSALKNQNEEQRKINVDLQKQIDELKTLITDKVNTTSTISNQQKVSLPQTAKLEQNQPNPTTQSTIIKYFIPEQISSAVIRITNSSGQEVKSINLSQKNNGQITLQTNDLVNGSYFYSLIIDGKTVDTKKMVITH